MASLAYPASDRDLIKRGLMIAAHVSGGHFFFFFSENHQPFENTCRPCCRINEQGCKLSHIQRGAQQLVLQALTADARLWEGTQLKGDSELIESPRGIKTAYVDGAAALRGKLDYDVFEWLLLLNLMAGIKIKSSSRFILQSGGQGGWHWQKYWFQAEFRLVLHCSLVKMIPVKEWTCIWDLDRSKLHLLK